MVKKIIRGLLILGILTGIGLILYGVYFDYKLNANIDTVKKEYASKVVDIDKIQKEPSAKKGTASKTTNNSQGAELNTNQNKETNTEIDSGSVSENLDTVEDTDTRGYIIGKVSVPSVGISLPIFKGNYNALGQDNMLYGAITNKINQKMGEGNYVLSSHLTDNPNLLFSPLSKSKIGDKIYIADTKYLYTYVITEEKTVQPTDIWILDDVAGKNLITLYTCVYINKFSSTGQQLTDRTVRVGELQGKEKLTDKLSETYFGF